MGDEERAHSWQPLEAWHRAQQWFRRNETKWVLLMDDVRDEALLDDVVGSLGAGRLLVTTALPGTLFDRYSTLHVGPLPLAEARGLLASLASETSQACEFEVLEQALVGRIVVGGHDDTTSVVDSVLAFGRAAGVVSSRDGVDQALRATAEWLKRGQFVRPWVLLIECSTPELVLSKARLSHVVQVPGQRHADLAFSSVWIVSSSHPDSCLPLLPGHCPPAGDGDMFMERHGPAVHLVPLREVDAFLDAQLHLHPLAIVLSARLLAWTAAHELAQTSQFQKLEAAISCFGVGELAQELADVAAKTSAAKQRPTARAVPGLVAMAVRRMLEVPGAGRLAVSLLGLLSFMSPGGTPLGLLQDLEQRDQCLDVLCALGLTARRADLILCHETIQDAVHDLRLDPLVAAADDALRLLNTAGAEAALPSLQPALARLERMVARGTLTREQRLCLALLRSKSGLVALAYLGDADLAADMQHKALSMLQAELGPDHPEVADTCRHLGDALVAQGRDYEAAIGLYRQAERVMLTVLPPDCPALVAVYSSLGEGLRCTGDYAAAIQCYEKAATIQLAELGPDHLALAATNERLGMLHASRGAYELAAACHHTSLRLRQMHLGPDHLEMAQSLNNLGEALHSQGSLEAAADCHRKAEAVIRAQLGAEHPMLATVLHNLGGVFCSQGDYGMALAYFSTAESIQLAALGPDHLDLAQTYNSRGSVCFAEEDYDAAITYHCKAETIVAARLGAHHPELAAICYNVAQACRAQGDTDRAVAYYRRAVDILRTSMTADHPLLAASCLGLGDLLRLRGEYDAAIECYRLAEAAVVARHGFWHPELAIIYVWLHVCLTRARNYPDAEVFGHRAVALLPSAHPVSALLHGNLSFHDRWVTWGAFLRGSVCGGLLVACLRALA